MNKGLEALERIVMPDEVFLKECKRLNIDNHSDYETIKKELQRLEAIDNAKPSEALESLKTPLHNEWLRVYSQFKEIGETTKIVDGCRMVKSDADNYLTIKQYILKSQKKEKALEIIKKKHINPFTSNFQESKNAEEYNHLMSISYEAYWIKALYLTQEEFDLLKEVLCDE